MHPRTQLVGRAIVLLAITYVMAVGGTFNGIINAELQVTSLLVLTFAVVIWLGISWVRPVSFSPPLAPALVLWGITYAGSCLFNHSGRVYIGLWYAGFYAGAWLLLCDLLSRGMPTRWIADGLLIALIPLVLLAFLQVLPWYLAWITRPDVDVAFVPPRPPSTLGNPNAFGAVLAMALPIGIMRMRSSSCKRDSLLWGIWIVGNLTALYLTFSRGAWLAAGGALCVLVVFDLLESRHAWMQKIFSWWRGSKRTLVLVAAGLTVGAAMFSLEVFQTPRRGLDLRWQYYEIAFESFAGHPVFGAGPFTYGLTLLGELSIPPNQPQAHAHNIVLNLAAELGTVGLGALAGTLVLILRRFRVMWRTVPDDQSRLLMVGHGAALAAFCLHGMVDMPMMMPGVMLVGLAILASATAFRPERARWLVPPVVQRGLTTALWAAVLATGWWSSHSYRNYIRAERLLTAAEYATAADALAEVAASRPDLALYHAEHGFACGLLAAKGDTSRLQDGISAYETALRLEREHPIWLTNLAMLYWQAAMPGQAIEEMEKANSLAPDDPTIALNLGIFYEETGRSADAQRMYRRALTIEPLLGHTVFWQKTVLRRELVACVQVAPTPYMQAETIWHAGDQEAALALLEAALERDPTQPAPYIDVARLFLSTGGLAAAEDYLQTAHLLIQTDLDQARWHVAKAELASARGEIEERDQHLESARALILPDATGIPVYYGRDIAYYQFLRDKVKGTLLPQVTVLGPDPQLIQALEHSIS